MSVGRCSRNELPSMLPIWCLGRSFGSLPICRRDTMMRIGLGSSKGPKDTTGGDRTHMKRSIDRILTTHTGSLPRTAKVMLADD